MAKLQTDRTRLRRFQLSDLDNMIQLESDPDVMRFTSMRVPLSTEESAKRLKSVVEKESSRAPLGVWAAELKESSEFFGWFMILKTDLELPELGFMIVKKHWGKGLATEAGGALVNHALKTLKLDGLMAVVDPENESSMRVLEKLGFAFQGTVSKEDKARGIMSELNLYKLESRR